MAGTWPDTTVESADGSRTTFTLTSGLSPVNPLVTVGGASGALTVGPTQFSFSGAVCTLGFAPVSGESVLVYFLATGVSTGNPGVTTLGAVRTAAQQRADMVNSTFVTTAEWNSYINASYFELYDLLVQKYGNDYYATTNYTFTTDGVNEFYALPAAFYKGLGVEVQINGSATNWATLKKFPFVERNRFSIPGVQVAYGLRGRLRYRFNGNNIWLKPLPVSGQVIRILYVPRMNILVNDTDTLDGISGWEEYVLTDAVIKAKVKEETDPSPEMAMKAALTARIEAAAENRDAGSPEVVGDARGLSGRGYGLGYDGDDWDREAW